MRQIEERMVNAVNNYRNFSCSNTVVNVSKENGCTVIRVYLHNNCIFEKAQNLDGLFVRSFTLAGWNTNVTRSRLRALGVDVYQKNYTPMYNGKEISKSKWYTV